jgi:ABC-type polysaccharide/polyol phosphate transport system ATPase subunit
MSRSSVANSLSRSPEAVGEGETVIRLENVTKVFRLYDDPIRGPLKSLLLFWRKERYFRTFAAVSNVSLTVKRGEVVGILGPNGSGKTTLLKVIAGLLPVNSGTVHVHGKVTALLALGVGVHPEFSGRENILFNGILLGLTKDEILSKTPDIVQFAEIGDFIDQPFRTYSSGMKARLLFAISMSARPDIMIVDEALATGDTYFVKKCARRIRELVSSGTTILFVSHNLHQIAELCDRAYLMSKGRLVEEGAPAKVIGDYNDLIFHDERERLKQWANPELVLMQGTGDILVQDVTLKNKDEQPTDGFYTGDTLKVEIHYRNCLPENVPVSIFIGFLQSARLNYVGFFNSALQDGSDCPCLPAGPGQAGIITICFDELFLTTNDYALWLILYRDGVTFCEYKGIRPFFVSRKDNAIDRGGYFMQPGRIVLP